MLIYCNKLSLNPDDGYVQVSSHIARWLGKKGDCFVKPEQLLRGMYTKFKDGATVRSISTGDENFADGWPFLLSVQFTHTDDRVSGRRWITEIGVRQSATSQPIECSVLLKTEELSALVESTVEVTRPRIVGELIDSCNPDPKTPGLSLKNVKSEEAKAFLMAIEHDSRSIPWVIVSPTLDGQYLVDPSWLGKVLVGIAEVYVIGQDVDTFQLEKIIGEQYAVWRGALNVISPMRRNRHGVFCSTKKLLPDTLRTMKSSGIKLENQILALVTHRTNLPNSWLHISTSVVSQAQLHRKLKASIARAGNSDASKEYVDLLCAADNELKEKEREVKVYQDDISTKEEEIYNLNSTVDHLNSALDTRKTCGRFDFNEEDNNQFRDSITSCCLSGEPTLEQALIVLKHLYSDRVIVLESAFNSAKESEGFLLKRKAFELLLKLVTDYWEVLVTDGGGDTNAKRIFGSDTYSAKEAKTLSKAGKDRRTFKYLNNTIFMRKHLKIGVKESVAKTFRTHFEWFPREKKIVIGHCGKHLNYK